MTNHRIHFAGYGDTLQGRCSCGKKSAIGTRADADGWHYAHLQEIERIRTYLGTRKPTLKSQHAWFSEQAENADNDPDDRALWRQLADEIEAFLRSREPLPQDTLF